MPNKSKLRRSHGLEAQIVRINRRLLKRHRERGVPLLRVKKLRPTRYECISHDGSCGEFVAIEVSTGKIVRRTQNLNEWDYETAAFVRKWKSINARNWESKLPANSPNATEEEPAPVRIIYRRETE